MKRQHHERKEAGLNFPERGQFKEALRASQQILEGIINAIPVRVFWKDKNLVYLGCNAVFARDAGFADPKDIIGKDDTQMGWRDQAELYRADDRQVIESGRSKYLIEEPQTTPEGKTITLLTSKMPLRDSAGKIIGVLGTYMDITDRKGAEEALRASEKKYRLLINTAHEAIIVVQDGLLKFVNPGSLGLLGGDSELELMDRPFSEFVHPDDRNMVVENYRRRTADKVVIPRYAFRVITRDGLVKWVEINAAMIEWQGKSATLNFLTDITERKAAEEALKESEATLANALQMAHAGHWEYDVDRDVFTFNDNFYRIFRTTAAAVGGCQMSSRDYARRFCHPDDIAVVANEIRAAIESTDPNYSRQIEHRILFSDGEVGTMTVRFFIVKDPQGRTVKTYGVNQDITERKRAEQQLRESEAKYEVLFKGSSHGILATDIETERFIFANPSICQMLGYSEEELLQLSVSDIHPKEAQAQVMSEMRIQIRDGRSLVHDVPCRKKDGTMFFADIGGGSTFVNGRELAVGFFADATERREVEEEIQRTSQELRERNEELNRFIYAVSHDLRSPLVTIQTFQGHLEQDIRSHDAARVETDLGYIQTAADKMSRLLDEIRNLSRVGRISNPSVESPLQAIVKEALDLVAGRITTRGVRVVVTEEPVVLYGDRTRFVEVFQNLVDNAVKFMGDQESPRIEIGVEQAGGEITLYVRDNGIGISQGLRPLVFGLFRQLDPASEGEGLGLALVKRIVEVHGGRIWVESDGPGKGATFRFTLAKTKRAAGRKSPP
jgi:PAS domain S-box-containing protein